MEPSTRVLIVDDDAATRTLLEHLLSEAPDLEPVGYADSAEEATALAEALQPDVIVLDLVLGALDGRDFVGALRSAAPGARLLVLTVLAAVDAEESSRAAGADAFLTKSPEVYVRLVDDLRTLGEVTRAGE